MTTATIILWMIALGLGIYAWIRQDKSLERGLNTAWQVTLRNALLLVIAFLIVGYVNVLSPTKLIQTWLGPASGWRGLLLAEVVGMLLPGGPYVVFPLITVLYKAGAGLGAVITLITSWSTQAFLTVTFELPFMGWRFSAIRWGLALGIPIIAGVVAQLIFA